MLQFVKNYSTRRKKSKKLITGLEFTLYIYTRDLVEKTDGFVPYKYNHIEGLYAYLVKNLEKRGGVLASDPDSARLKIYCQLYKETPDGYMAKIDKSFQIQIRLADYILESFTFFVPDSKNLHQVLCSGNELANRILKVLPDTVFHSDNNEVEDILLKLRSLEQQKRVDELRELFIAARCLITGFPYRVANSTLMQQGLVQQNGLLPKQVFEVVSIYLISDSGSYRVLDAPKPPEYLTD